jgi:hypothetical protein
VRANVAWYDNSASLADELGSALGGDGTTNTGRIGDYGIGWIWYPRRRWEGFTLEAGALRRDRAARRQYDEDLVVKTRSTTYAGRAMIGWSWLLTRHTYVAVAVGLSAGREAGTERTVPVGYSSQMPTTTEVERLQVDGEGYLRLGFAFGE